MTPGSSLAIIMRLRLFRVAIRPASSATICTAEPQGNQYSEVIPTIDPANPSGPMPTTVTDLPLSRMVLPMMDGSPP